MSTLFPIERQLPEGFLYMPDFITPEEEGELVRDITKLELATFVFQGFEAKRKVASFGYDYSFDKRALTKGKDIPPFFTPVINRVSKQFSIEPQDFAELLVLEYPVSAVINWHRDAPPFDIIVGISLLADCTFRLRPHAKIKQGRGSIISLPVKRRSLYLMQGPARSEWQHSTAPVKEVRYSITLRTLRQ
ncbi:MAG: alpha-ketoglutarate-dependent dioxygenase AlkB [Bacteroidota bacterium]|nr:alpha-ketoglutarate-dependent dioxygenase AlkB [Bacteroidota bacterium]